MPPRTPPRPSPASSCQGPWRPSTPPTKETLGLKGCVRAPWRHGTAPAVPGPIQLRASPPKEACNHQALVPKPAAPAAQVTPGRHRRPQLETRQQAQKLPMARSAVRMCSGAARGFVSSAVNRSSGWAGLNREEAGLSKLVINNG